MCGNYSAFIQRLELSIYRADDTDLVQPVGRLELPVAAVSQGDWEGRLSGPMPFRIGLDVDDGGTRQGAMIALERDLTRNFRVGVGYDFTDFSDDLTELDYDYRGWFINFTGRYRGLIVMQETGLGCRSEPCHTS